MHELELEKAEEIFAKAIARIRSRTYPLPATKENDFWILQDQPHREKARAAELITTNPNPDEHIKIGDRLHAARYHSSLLLTPEQETETLKNFKEAGFRRIIIEPFYTINPADAILHQDQRVQRVTNPELDEAVRKANNGRRQIEHEHLIQDNADIRLYAATENGKIIGWVSSHKIENLGNWVSNLYVHPDHRNQKLGASLMSAMLQDDARLGSTFSVLAASHLGNHLYPKLGYNQIATIHVHRPPNYPRKPRDLCL